MNDTPGPSRLKRYTRRLAPAVLAVLFIAWIVLIVVLIAMDPDSAARAAAVIS
jgi:hypothetical protein